MFKASLQRQANLGNAARRHLSSLALRTSRSSPSCVAISSRTWSQAAIRPSPLLSQIIQRCYSSESAAVREDEASHDSSTSDSPSGLITHFADLVKLGVNENLVQALTHGMGYDKMTEVQSLTINSALKGVDLVAQAKTGTGKTLAFLVPVFQRILNSQPELSSRMGARRSRPSSQDIRAIILSPTRELAEQIGVEARKLARNTGITVQTAVGGTRKREALYQMQMQGCHILVATPGRLQDILSDPGSRVAAPNLQAVVLDEADRMLDVGFADAIRDIINLLPDIKTVDRQTLLFSATIPRDVVHLAKSMVKTDNFEFVQTIKADETPTHHKVPQHVVSVKGYENFFPAIMEIANKAMEQSKQDPSSPPFKAIVFFSNTATVQFAHAVLNRTSLGGRQGLPIWDIHSRLTQAQRTRHAESFRRATSGILISSDVTARGMDFPGVTHVIQVGLPPDRDQYIHRVGRTGRAGKAGEGWLLLAAEEVAEARYRLPNLPIKPHHDLESASHAVGEDQPPPQSVAHHFDELSLAYQSAPRSLFRAVYLGMLGQKFSRDFRAEDVIALLNGWSSKGLGWPEPPAVPPKVAANRGFSRIAGLRIGYDNDEDDFSQRSGFGSGERSGFGSGERSGFGSGGRSGFGSGGRSGFGSGERSGFGSDERSGFGSGGRSGFGSGGRGGSGSGGRGGFGSGGRGGFGSGGRGGSGSGGRGGFGSGGRSGSGSGGRGGFGSGRRGNSFEDKFGSRVQDQRGDGRSSRGRNNFF